MNAATLTATGELASELHALLRETDPANWRDSVAASARERLARIRASLQRLRSAVFEQPALEAAVSSVAELVDDTSPESDEHPPRSYWMQLRARLMPAYEHLAAQLRARSLPVPTLRPTNWARISFHVASALGALVLLELVLSPSGTVWATGLFAATCWFLEAGRFISTRWNDRLMRVRFFQLIIHPHEHHRVNSATWYGTALFVLALFSPAISSAAALAVLGFGDPVAGLVGRRWGRTPVIGGRTLEGSLAFALVGTLAAWVVLLLCHPVAPLGALLGVAALAAVAGAAAEALSGRIDDNFSVPTVAALAGALGALALGVPL